jgi:nucleotide-binding universal stress UspA family protein
VAIAHLEDDRSMTTETSSPAALTPADCAAFSRIAVGVNGLPEGEDALALGAALAEAAEAELMLVAVHPDLLVVLPPDMDWTSLRHEARDTLRNARKRRAPGARMTLEHDVSVPRALRRVVRRDHRDLLVLGSSRHAPNGHIRIGKRTRQLLGQFDCALAVAPRGLHKRGEPTLRRIGVGYDGGPEAQAALGLAGSLAESAGATLCVTSVLDDRLPPIGWSSLGRGTLSEYWGELLADEMDVLRQDLETATKLTRAPVEIDVQRGRPADRLLDLTHNLDLLVIGSRRWGPVSRLVLGSTGEAAMHDAACPVIAVPRPPA